MDALSPDVKREILKRVFPELRFGGDPEVERYFELRRSGRLAEALSVYNGVLRVRYPADRDRVELLGLYRARDPGYAELQERLLAELASRLAASLVRNIDLVVQPLAGARLDDAMGALKAIEGLLARLGRDSEAALALLARYADYAGVLGYRAAEARRALELLREYDAVSRSDAPADYDFVARSEALEAGRRRAAGLRRPAAAPGTARAEEGWDFVARSAARERGRAAASGTRGGFFDPARIKFTAAERASVEISPALSRREDKVLAFCAKYWPRARDPAFERVVFLYARKYGTRHYEILRAVKLGRARGATDDEILSAVSAILSSGYEYSLSGDLYMQVMWRRLRARMEAREVAQRLAAPGPESKVRAARQGPEKAGTARPPEPARAAAEPSPARSLGRAAAAVPRPKATEPAGGRRGSAAAKPRAAKPRAAAAPRPAAPKAAKARAPASSPPKPSLERAPRPRGAKLLKRPPSGPAPVPELRGKGSISDKIRALSGKAYDVYREIFLERVRDDIHRELLAHPSRAHSLFDTASNEAENHIYGYMVAHYDDPFMDWEASAERAAVEALGYSMPRLDPIIEACFKKL
ncbi:MAG TPA: hypothetical protein PLB91_11470 [Spirochaetales bacterium]|nr:hypothetical protein [Spirochaetales bacterium]HRY54585.1 hypothetical protein [Spirochaetia bacterium]HRZ65604.1 hypothetical protein [Spirochaetia bacterium]